MPANPSALSFYGVAKEATPGTYAPPTQGVPLTKFDPDDKITWIKDTGVRGSMVTTYGMTAAIQYSEIDAGGDVYPDTFGFVVAGATGDVTTTGAAAPYTHAFAVKNSGTGQPTSQSWTDFDAVDTRGYTGTQVNDLTVKWDGEKALTFDAKLVGFVSTVQTKPTQSASAIPLVPGWECNFQIAGAADLTLIDAELAIKRSTKPIPTATGSQSPAQIFVGPAEVTGKMVVLAATNTQLTNYLTVAQPSLDFTFTQGAGAALTQVKFHLSKANYETAKPNRSKEWVEYDITFEAISTAADAGASGGVSPLKVTLQNALAAGTYL